jgi:hypothetical protein
VRLYPDNRGELTVTANEYLKEVLVSQDLGDDSDEMKALQKHRAEVEKIIRESFKDTALTIRYAGSKAKGTMDKESYDLTSRGCGPLALVRDGVLVESRLIGRTRSIRLSNSY